MILSLAYWRNALVKALRSRPSRAHWTLPSLSLCLSVLRLLTIRRPTALSA